MGNRTRKVFAFATRNLGNGAVKAAQFLRNTGRSAARGIQEGFSQIDDIELYDAPKPQATRRKQPKKNS